MIHVIYLLAIAILVYALYRITKIYGELNYLYEGLSIRYCKLLYKLHDSGLSDIEKMCADIEEKLDKD